MRLTTKIPSTILLPIFKYRNHIKIQKEDTFIKVANLESVL